MGIFLAIEGPKGVGKTTIASALHQRLADLGDDNVVLTKEPTPGFDLQQEAHLLGVDLARAIAHDRAVHVEETIMPALSAGKTIVCDRYILSSLVFHSTDGVPIEEIWRLNRQFPLPDANLVLAAPSQMITMRRSRRIALSRLESASTPSAEYDKYLHFGQEMKRRGVSLKILPSETPGDLDAALEWIMHSIRYGVIS
jgi:dTMP kinase